MKSAAKQKAQGDKTQRAGSQTAKNQSFLVAFWPVLLAIAGTLVLIFASYNQLTSAPKASEERSRLQRSQLVIDIFEGQRDQWTIALNQELAREKRNEPVLLRAAYETVVASARWRAALAMRSAATPEVYRNAIGERKAIIERGEQLYTEGKVDDLLKFVQAFVAVMKGRDELRRFDDEYSTRVDRANQNETETSTRIATAYIIGSVMMLVSTVGASLQSTQILNKIHSHLVRT